MTPLPLAPSSHRAVRVFSVQPAIDSGPGGRYRPCMVSGQYTQSASEFGENTGLVDHVRLSRQVIEQIRKTIRDVFSESARVILFGSRAQLEARGGDLDLLVIDDAAQDVLARGRLRCVALLQLALGEQHIDLVVTPNPEKDERLIVREALRTGVSL